MLWLAYLLDCLYNITGEKLGLDDGKAYRNRGSIRRIKNIKVYLFM